MAGSSSNANTEVYPYVLNSMSPEDYFPPHHMVSLVTGHTPPVKRPMCKTDVTRQYNRLVIPKQFVETHVSSLMDEQERQWLWTHHTDVPVALQDSRGKKFEVKLGIRAEGGSSVYVLLDWKYFLDDHRDLTRTSNNVNYECSLWFYRERVTGRLCAYLVYKKMIRAPIPSPSRPLRTLDLLSCFKGASTSK